MVDIEGIIALFIPIVFLSIFPLVMWFRYRAQIKGREEVQKTLRLMIENGQTISSELLDKMTEPALKTDPATRKEKDLRWGVILVALGVAIMVFGIFDEGLGARGNWDDVWDYFGGAAIFVIIGLARLGLWKYSPIEPKQ